MTDLQEKFFKHLRTGCSQVEAARRAGSTNPVEYAHAQQRYPGSRAKLQKLLAKLELKEAQVLQPFIDALAATKVLVVAADGKFTDRTEVPDWEHRLKAADWLAQQLRLKQAPPASGDSPCAIYLVYGHQVALQTQLTAQPASANGA